ncbi:MAG TPA: aminoglycoside 3'-phosphotransferase [Acidimicrobiales bacterium]|nr:aminoglycoside 3'-phosphotransferase [Acidimicrobiales bacterium]
MVAGPPERDVGVPAVVFELAAGRPVRAVWLNELGGSTFELGAGSDRCFAKWAPADSALDLDGEASRMMWTRPFSVVPEVIALGEDTAGSWLATTPLSGESAVADRWRQEPTVAVTAIGIGLRHLHDHAPVGSCPFSWSVSDRIARARQRVADGTTHPSAWHRTHQDLTLDDALAIAADPPEVDHLVVCHGDACAPNTMIDAGRWSGHVDLGSLGVADRWADLAIATWSTEWNYGPGWERTLFDAYGIEPDPARTAYYRLLWDLT